MVKVKAPSAIVPGISRLGRSAWRNSAAAMGYTANATTNSETPPYVSTAQASTMAKMARCAPSQATMACAMTRAAPEASMSLPNTAPSKNSGKNAITKPPSAGMNTCV
jgi:hypothetical protein